VAAVAVAAAAVAAVRQEALVGAVAAAEPSSNKPSPSARPAE
jgi:hypothetical protein